MQALLTDRQAAAVLNLSLASFRRRARRGEIPGQVRLGERTTRYDPAELKRWFDTQRTEKASSALTRRDLVRLVGHVIGVIAALLYLVAAIINHESVAQHLLSAVLRLL